MKKLLFIPLLFLAWVHIAEAACTCTDAGLERIGGRGKYRLVATCTADATPTTCTDNLSVDTMKKIGGKYPLDIMARPGGTPPDAASLEIKDSVGRVWLTAAQNGSNLIHATDTIWDYFDGNRQNLNSNTPFHKDRPLTFTITPMEYV